MLSNVYRHLRNENCSHPTVVHTNAVYRSFWSVKPLFYGILWFLCLTIKVFTGLHVWHWVYNRWQVCVTATSNTFRYGFASTPLPSSEFSRRQWGVITPKSSDLFCAHDCFAIFRTWLLLLHWTIVTSLIFAITVRSFIVNPVEVPSLHFHSGTRTVNHPRLFPLLEQWFWWWFRINRRAMHSWSMMVHTWGRSKGGMWLLQNKLVASSSVLFTNETWIPGIFSSIGVEKKATKIFLHTV